ncbi:MAG: hypothetical protein R2788_26885 [Saprospiraceae bacterium]
MKTTISTKQISLVLFLLGFFTSVNQMSAQTLAYGDVIHLQNGWNKYQGGYLDTRGYQKDFEKTGNFLCVSTATSDNRDLGSGSWRVMSATGKKEGSPVLIGDEVYLLNQWNSNGGYLDTRGYQKDFEKTGNHLCVSTATSNNRDAGSGTWRILSSTRKGAGTPVTEGTEIHLQNGWNKYQGGYLDTRGYQKDFEKTGNHLCVSTATNNNRDAGSGTWKVKIAERNHLDAGETLKAGERLMSANGEFILRMQEEDGNLCVYKYAKGKQGGFVWGSMKYGFKNGKLVMQTDGNLVVYDGSNAAKWSSQTHPYYNAKFKDSNNKPVKLVLENNGVLKLYNAKGEAMWSSR